MSGCCYNKEFDIMFVHIPKCFGTAIVDQLEKYGFKTCYAINKHIVRSRPSTPYDKLKTADSKYGSLQYIIDNDKIDISNTFIFTFMRDPYFRYMSGLSFIQMHKSPARKYWNYWHTNMPQVSHLKLNNKIKVNFIGICENFENDWNLLMKILSKKGLQYIPLPLKKKSTKTGVIITIDSSKFTKQFEEDIKVYRDVIFNNKYRDIDSE